MGKFVLFKEFKIMKKRVLFYSSVSNKDLFYIQRFYSIDIDILVELGFSVIVTNRILTFLLFWKYDISFLYFYKKSIFAAIISKLYNKRIYFTGGIDDLNKNTTSDFKYFLQKILFKSGYFLCTKCIIVSHSDLNNIRRIFKKELDKIEFSHHAIDINLFKVKEEFHKQDIFSTILWMGSINNVIRKGVDKAIYSFAQLIESQDLSNFNFYIVGKQGEGTQYLKSIIAKLKLEKRIIFTGALSEEEKIAYLKKSKYYFQLSKYEGFGLAALEALASDNIVIHSGEGGLKDAVNKYGIVFNMQNDITEESHKLRKMILELSETELILNKKEASFYIECNFSQGRRMNDFHRILSSI
jgi:glycosyltransferase involved in cell wall biosynthesis